jgi:choline dehydrogenase-like flavoprotein
MSIVPMVMISSSQTCSRTTDYILIGSGAGGTPAAAMLKQFNANFIWLEAGQDESSKLLQYEFTDFQNQPTGSYPSAY